MENLVMQIKKKGFCRIPNIFYEFDNSELSDFQESYFRLPKDQSHGERYRAYSKYKFKNEQLSLEKVEFYAQSKEYNNEYGGKPRKFEPIENKILSGKMLESLINQNTSLAKKSKEVDFDEKVNIGVHQIRYCGSSDNPSYASPLWLHRDDENLVFIHLLNLSANASGGDNLIAYEPKKIAKLIRLIDPLDTLLVTKKHLHSVTPIGSRNEAIAYRDILLITFDNEIAIKNRISILKENSYA